MNDLILNIRFLYWHLQIRENLLPRIIYNEYHRTANTPCFRVYQFGDHFFQ